MSRDRKVAMMYVTRGYLPDIGYGPYAFSKHEWPLSAGSESCRNCLVAVNSGTVRRLSDSNEYATPDIYPRFDMDLLLCSGGAGGDDYSPSATETVTGRRRRVDS